MAAVELASVLHFLRINGLSECESALMEDVRDNSPLGSSDSDKFLSPMAPPPPPLRIPPREVPDAGGESSKNSSEDEFVSLGSSTTDLCSSDFTNPYGVRTSRPMSQASSSDRMSQFGTARDYPDFDMQNDLFWYKENDADYYSMLPPFSAAVGDTDGFPSEDKHITGVQKGAGASRGNSTGKTLEDYPKWDHQSQLTKGGGGDDECRDHRIGYSCLDPLCACCGSTGRVYADDPVVFDFETQKLGDNLFAGTNCTYDWQGGFEDTLGSQSVDKDDPSSKNDEVIPQEPNEPGNKEGSSVIDELSIYDAKDEGYEIFHLRIIHRKNRTGFEENKEFPIVMNSIVAGRYYVTEFLGSAAFSKVVQAHDLCAGQDVCLKIIKNDKDFFDQSLDEIKLLKFVNKHDPVDKYHILRLYDYFYYQVCLNKKEHLFIVTELLRANLYEFEKYNRESGGEPYFTISRLQVIARQCLEALMYLHDLGIIHCDLKPENILIKSYRKCEIKVIDLGSSCFQTDSLTLYVQSRSYRAPEVMLGLPYDPKIDIWSLGCILAELCSGEVLFPNEAVVMILARIIGILGPIDRDMLLHGQETDKYFTEEYDLYHITEGMEEVEYIVPEQSSLEHQLGVGVSDPGLIDFLKYLLETNPERRPTAKEALQHPWLAQVTK
ncbi:uncharacterized protein LOC127244993 isoform X2 [Andrographis paniculata]|uniref:uncharacterized protein LOC127244993 isoform X2 n=1 Tax=Andrographis paniculata TaxID=175694 RepID=UPI0021E6D7DB|nr:uncharacterized protein LOC127244993 isoform X2 [Andrographis paniculata]